MHRNEIEISPSKSASSHKSCSTSISEGYQPNSEEISTNDVCTKKMKFKNDMYRMTIKLINENPKRYIGFLQESMFIIKILSEESGVSIKDIYITLQKIKLNENQKSHIKY